MKKINLKKLVALFLAIVSLGAIGFAGWQLYGIWQQDHQIEKETEELEQFLYKEVTDPSSSEATDPSSSEEMFAVDWNGLQATNPCVIAWIFLPDTSISYPVVQGSDNSYYLNHTFAGAYNTMGAIFLDSFAQSDFEDDNSIVYGHSVSDIGGMFTDLTKYTNQNFFQSHPYFWLLTPKQNYKVNTYAFYQGSDEGSIYTTDFGDFEQDVLTAISKESMYYQTMDVENKHFISLSTCDLKYGFYSNQRYVLMGALEEWDEGVPLSGKI